MDKSNRGCKHGLAAGRRELVIDVPRSSVFSLLRMTVDPSHPERRRGRAVRALARLGQGLAVSAVTLLLALLALEAGMRLLGLGKPDVALHGFDRNNTRFRAESGRLNPWTRDSTNALRVAVIGDSVSNGAGVSKDDTFAYRLARLLNLNEGVPPAEVWLYAKGGTSTDQQLEFLEMALERKPHLVVLGISLNDTEDWHRPDELRRWRDERLPRIPPPGLARLLRHSRFLNWGYRQAETRRNYRAYLLHHQRLFDPSYSGFKRFRQAIDLFSKRCADADARCVALLFPDISQMGADPYPLQYAHDQIHGVLRNAGIPFLDLSDDFRGKDPYRLQAVPGIDGHPNEIGHRIVAESLLEFLLANQYVDRAYLPRSRSGSERQFWTRLSVRLHDPAAAAAEQEGPPLDEDLPPPAETPDPDAP